MCGRGRAHTRTHSVSDTRPPSCSLDLQLDTPATRGRRGRGARRARSAKWGRVPHASNVPHTHNAHIHARRSPLTPHNEHSSREHPPSRPSPVRLRHGSPSPRVDTESARASDVWAARLLPPAACRTLHDGALPFSLPPALRGFGARLLVLADRSHLNSITTWRVEFQSDKLRGPPGAPGRRSCPRRGRATWPTSPSTRTRRRWRAPSPPPARPPGCPRGQPCFRRGPSAPGPAPLSVKAS